MSIICVGSDASEAIVAVRAISWNAYDSFILTKKCIKQVQNVSQQVSPSWGRHHPQLFEGRSTGLRHLAGKLGQELRQGVYVIKFFSLRH